ncbi:MAG: HD domain-containing protein [Gemmatimonadales bacterium]|nr:HD domain-containing protein [Gemmatimonadales bacterium]
MTDKLQSPHALGDSVPLACLGVGDRLERTLMVRALDRRESSRGSFTIVSFGDRTGSVDSAPFWSDERRALEIRPGDIVHLTGRITQYAGRRQLKVTSLVSAGTDDTDPRRWLPSVADVGPLWNRIDGWRAEIATECLRRVTGLFYDDHGFRRRYELCPGSTTGHHAELGGLLRHTCEVVSIARAIGRNCGADLELVVVGALLHDIGKLEAYDWRSGFTITEAGSLVGHVVLGALMISRRLADEDAPGIDPAGMAVLLHLLLSHHGTREQGAPIPPMTLEAEVLRYADDASARTSSMAAALSDRGNFDDTATISRPVWQLDRRRTYRGIIDWGRKGSEGTEGGTKNGTAV